MSTQQVILQMYAQIIAVFAALIGTAVAFVVLYLRRRRSADRKATLFGFRLADWLALVATASVIFALLQPARMQFPVPRKYLEEQNQFEGRDQFEWARDLYGGDAKDRPKAIAALCDLMKRPPPEANSRWAIANALISAKAIEAVPALVEMLQSKDDDLRQPARYALEEIDPASLKK